MRSFALVTIFALGCVTDDTDVDCDESGKCDGNGSLHSTFNGNTLLYGGFHSLFDKTSSQCVQPKAGSAGAQINVGSLSESIDLTAITSREELASELGLDLGLKVKYLTTDADATVNLVRKTKTTSTSINLLLKVSRSYIVRNRHAVVLTDDAAAKLAEGAGAFVQTCGTHYVNGIRYGSNLFVLITYDARDEQTALEVKASLGIKGGALGAAKLDADTKSRMSRAASIAGVNVKVRGVAHGFSIGGSAASNTLVSDLLGTGVSAETFRKIDDIRAHMAKSLDTDACRDAGNGTCEGQPSPGFLNNTRRGAMTTGVDLGFYDALPNVQPGSPSAFKTIKEKTQALERFVRDWTELEERMDVIYRNELEPFLAASATDKAAYQVAPPGAAKRSPTELLAVANTWSEKFFPDSGTQIGTIYEIASNTIRDCWQRAAVDFNIQCTPNNTPGTETAAWKGVLAEIEKYGREGRILPLQYKVHGSIAHRQVAGACAKFNASGVTYRPATLAEVPLLAPLVGFGAIAWDGDAPNETWFSHPNPSQMCGPTSGFPNPFFRNNPAASATEFRCGEADGVVFDGREINLICVPAGGPLPLVEAP